MTTSQSPDTNGSAAGAMPTIERLDAQAQGASPDASCALTIDVEDWYQSCVDYDAPISDRVVRNVDRVLEVLADRSVAATFFVQGLVAAAFPRVVERIAAEGHEVQSHAHTHRPLHRMSRAGLREELERGRSAVEDAAGTAVSAFRAPDFSIGLSNLWAFEVVAECGFGVDSSIFPMRVRRYGVEDWELAPHRLGLRNGATLVEAPVAVLERAGVRVPVAGGGYFRLLPHALLRRSVAGILAAGRPAILYCHPYEFNPRELEEYRGRVPGRLRLTQGLGRTAFVARLERLLDEFPFDRLDRVLPAPG